LPRTTPGARSSSVADQLRPNAHWYCPEQINGGRPLNGDGSNSRILERAQTVIRTIVWNEFIHERENAVVQEVYPHGIHAAIAAALDTDDEIDVSTATLDQPEHGLPTSRLDAADVLIWWGHKAHGQVSVDVVERVVARVHQGMGLIVLHSGHFARVFQRLMGTPCSLRWREAGERERLWVINRSHPIVQGVGPSIELPNA